MYGMSAPKDRYVSSLEHQVETLKEKVAALEAELTEGRKASLPACLRLTAKECALLKMLYERAQVTRMTLWNELYSHLPNGGPEPKIIDVFICKMRRKLKPHGIGIETIWGQGYRMTPENKARLDELKKAKH